MAQIEFTFNGNPTLIQCKENEKIKEICKRFASKNDLDINTIYFLYSSIRLDGELTFEECANIEDKNRNKMNVLVYNINENPIIKSIIKSKDVICPKCGENAKINLKNYKIKIYGCKNNHEINDILLNEYENTQAIDQSKILCNICKEKNKGDTHNNEFYICNDCNINLCPLCKSVHNKEHNIINYENKNYICNLHNDFFNSYCNTCKLNLCMFCENLHNNHELIYFGRILPNIDNLKEKMNKLRNKIDTFNNNINNLIKKINKISKEALDNLERYYTIYNNFINNVDFKKRKNYESINNIKEFTSNDKIIIDIDKIINDSNINCKIMNIINLNNEFLVKENNNQIINDFEPIIFENKLQTQNNLIKITDKIKIIYRIKKDENKIKIFGTNFVKKNKNNFKILYHKKNYNLEEYFNLNNDSIKTDKLEIELKTIKEATDLSEMFYGCSSLLSLSDITYWDTSKVISMYKMFNGCLSLISLSDKLKWNTSNVNNMALMFFYCSSLSTLPDISEWDTHNVIEMYQMFDGCSSLKTLPDISKWNISKVNNLSWLFLDCSSLTYLPDISKWDTSNVQEMESVFNGCSSLKLLPDISKWNIANVTNMKDIFKGCKNSLNIPPKFMNK